MKKVLTLFVSVLSALTMTAQGWPENYDGIMLQGFYWDSYKDTKWTVLESQADELSQFFNLIWVPNSAYANATSNNMGYHPVYWFNHRSAFGTEAELRSMINTFKEKGVGLIEDVVINHRASVNSNWLNFPAETYKGETYQLAAADICQDDEAKNEKDANGNQKYFPTGAKDSGENWAGARDLDHSGANVQKNVMAYEDFLLNDLGYTGFRYDFVKGFSAKYVGQYNKVADVKFSVGECWDGNKTVVTNWINGTKVDGVIQSAAFDFPMKYYINDAFSQGKWSRLNGVALCNDNNFKRYAVTFVDNHDSGRFGDAPLYDNIEAANAFILMMPGTPCVWLSHWQQYPATIKKLITIRKSAGIHCQSNIISKQAKSNGYVLVTEGQNGAVALLLGSLTEADLPSSSYKLALKGTNYQVWVTQNLDLSALDAFGDDPAFTIPSFCKAGDDEICAFFEIPSSYGTIRCWAWNAKCNFTTGAWPGSLCRLLGTNKGNRVYKWTWNGKTYKPGTTTEMTPDGVPTQIIFNNATKDNNGNWSGKQTADLTFVNGGYYVEQGTLRAVVATDAQSITLVDAPRESAAIYTLDGRLVSQPTKPGIYIRNNKKVVIR